MNTPRLFVQSHVGRDLLQSAAVFKNERLTVWEYVSNGLQYVNEGVTPEVRVRLDPGNKQIVIADNGRGMSMDDLANFFMMHGENQDRRAGQSGRGRFGTGKSAAFGIGTELTVETVRAGKRSKVRITRAAIQAMDDHSPVPVEVIEDEVRTDRSNGTVVTIGGIQLKTLDQKAVIDFIEKHLARWPRPVKVWVNKHECEYNEPHTIRVETHKPTGDLVELLGECELTLKVAARPLDAQQRGVAIFSGGVWHETTLAGCEGRDIANHIFGDMDVPLLDRDSSAVAAFDMSRSMQLNQDNDIVRAIFAFVGSKVDHLRRELVAQEKERRATEEAKRLREEGEQIAKLINEDFSDYRARVAKARARQRGAADLAADAGGATADDDLIFGGDQPAEIVSAAGGPGGDGGPGEGGVGDEPRQLKPNVRPGGDGAPAQGKPAGGKGKKPRNAGGFDVQFRDVGEDEDRACYQSDGRLILINTAHPQLRAALKSDGGTKSPTFRRLAYEVAFTEYALGLSFELAARDEFIEFTDPLDEVREAINRIARRAARLYEEGE